MAIGVALGGHCLSDVAMLTAERAVFGPLASDPTLSRLVDTLAKAGRGRWPRPARHGPKYAGG